MLSPLRVVIATLYRPYNLIEDLKTSPSRLWIALAIGMLVAIGAPVSALAFISRLSAGISNELIVAIISLPFISTMLCGIAIMVTPLRLGMRPAQYTSFWFVILQMTVTPFLMLGVTAILSLELTADGQLTLTQFVLLVLVLSIAAGKGISIMIFLNRGARPLIDGRWVLVISLSILAGALWFAPQTRNSPWLILALVMLGVAWAQLRVGAWLWQACWTLMLVGVHAARKDSHRLTQCFPACFDQMRLLPLPGTTALLRYYSRTSGYEAACRLARLADQPNDRWLAQRFVRRLLPDPQTHAIFFWLSVDPSGQALLQSITASRRDRLALIQAYAHLSHVSAPGAWRLELERSAAALIAAPMLPDLAWMPLLIDSAQRILEARSWEHVQQNSGSQTIDELLRVLRAQIYHTLGTNIQIVPATSWPVQLLDTAAEHVAFLKDVE